MADKNNQLTQQFATAQRTALATFQKRVADIARARNAAIMVSDPRPSAVTRIVDGVVGALEDQVRQQIIYRYLRLDQVINFALALVKGLSPVRSGLYRDSWFALIDGERANDFRTVGVNSQIMITNDQPYSRKIDIGHMKLSVPPHIVESAAPLINARFGNIAKAQPRFIVLPNGYVLKDHSRDRVTKRRPGAGASMTYPAIQISPL